MQFYNQNADKLAQQYLSTDFTQVHHAWLHLLDPILSKPNASILDLGAGSGRDSLYLAQLGEQQNVQITAVEPVQEFSNIGIGLTETPNVNWVNDSLPALSKVVNSASKYDLILLSAVWMHIPPEQRAQSMASLASLLGHNGKIVILLRHGPNGDERLMNPVCINELIGLAHAEGLMPSLITKLDSDKLGRNEVSWQTIVLSQMTRL